ncbi:MAG: hypothetical protein QNI99_08915 [Woeseiaceae bacterium]|nr:hypothetical protein [Woeseiaceae bacterium]
MRNTPGAIVCAIVLAASSSAASAQDAQDLPLRVKSGDRLAIEYSHERHENGQAKTGNIVAEILIGDVSDDGFAATWTTQSVEVDGYLIDANSPEAADILLGVPIKYVASLDGAPIRISDRDRLLETMLNGPLFAQQPEEATESLRALMNSMSDDSLAALFLQVPTYMSLCQGMRLIPGEPFEYTAEVQSPVGGEPADAVVSYMLETFDRQSGQAHIEYRSELDPEGAKQMVLTLLEQIDTGFEPDQSEIDAVTIERKDTASCDIDIESGWVESMTVQSVRKVAGQFRSETFVISTSR